MPSRALHQTATGHHHCNQRISWLLSLSLGCQAVLNGIVLIALVLLASACSNTEHYPNADAFRADVARWGVVGLSLDAAKVELSRREFACDGARCHHDLAGFPCTQRLRGNLFVGTSHLVNSFEIWTINGELPTQCL
jgi:hypothetical protein